MNPTNVYQLKITLEEIGPPIWRRIQVSGATTLDRLHTVIQKTMGWKDAHLHEFQIRGRRYGVPDPKEPEYEVEKKWRVALREAAPAAGVSFSYVYDLGDSWTHGIVVERIETREQAFRYPACLAGAQACPPEDCGGPGGYEELLAALRDPKHASMSTRRPSTSPP